MKGRYAGGISAKLNTPYNSKPLEQVIECLAKDALAEGLPMNEAAIGISKKPGSGQIIYRIYLPQSENPVASGRDLRDALSRAKKYLQKHEEN